MTTLETLLGSLVCKLAIIGNNYPYWLTMINLYGPIEFPAICSAILSVVLITAIHNNNPMSLWTLISLVNMDINAKGPIFGGRHQQSKIDWLKCQQKQCG